MLLQPVYPTSERSRASVIVGNRTRLHYRFVFILLFIVIFLPVLIVLVRSLDDVEVDETEDINEKTIFSVDSLVMKYFWQQVNNTAHKCSFALLFKFKLSFYALT